MARKREHGLPETARENVGATDTSSDSKEMGRDVGLVSAGGRLQRRRLRQEMVRCPAAGFTGVTVERVRDIVADIMLMEGSSHDRGCQLLVSDRNGDGMWEWDV